MTKQDFKDMSIMDKGVTIMDGGYILAEDTLDNAYEKLWAKNPQLQERYERNMAWMKQPFSSPSTTSITEIPADENEAAKARLHSAKSNTPIMQALAAQINLTRKLLGVR